MSKSKIVYYKGNIYELEANKPIKSYLKNKKYMVYVVRGNKSKIIHFGNSKYEDYRQHKNEKRRQNYLKRAAGIKDKNSNFTKDNPMTANYYSMRWLWGYKGHKLLT
jgi:hypothetical protein